MDEALFGLVWWWWHLPRVAVLQQRARAAQVWQPAELLVLVAVAVRHLRGNGLTVLQISLGAARVPPGPKAQLFALDGS